MKISVSVTSALEFSTPCLVLPFWSDGDLPAPVAALNQQLDGLIEEVRSNDGFKAGIGDTRVIYTPGQPASRVLLLGLGKQESFARYRLTLAVSRGVRAVRGLDKADFAFAVPEIDGFDSEVLVGAVAEGILLGLASFDDFKADSKQVVESATLLVADDKGAEQAIETAQIVCAANLTTRALVNRPSNLKSPAYLAEVAEKIAEEKGLKVEVWDENKILEERMGALYGVGMGSANKPRFIVLDYTPEGFENEAPTVLVGKGMTFDSGGYSLKPPTSMEDMKDDMAGAGVVLGVMSAVSDLKIPRRIWGVIPTAENMVSSNAQRPGDIVTARNGLHIEVLNTDAEGRLILADALSWVSEQNPAAIIDLATLTGAIGIALGQEGAGLFSNDDELSVGLENSGLKVNEKLWRFPLWEDYDDVMKGSNSDLKNISGDRYAGSISAAIFLRYFVGKNIPWAHLDIAAVSIVKKEKHLAKHGATGFGVRLLLDYLRA